MAGLLVDIGPDIATASFEYRVSLAGISFCLLTHAHEDHFDPEFIMSRHEEYGTVLEKELLLTGSIADGEDRIWWGHCMAPDDGWRSELYCYSSQ